MAAYEFNLAYVLITRDDDGDFVVRDIGLDEQYMEELGAEMCESNEDYYVTKTDIKYWVD